MISIVVQAEPFDPGQLTHDTHGADPAVGALVAFTGYVRDFNEGAGVSGLFLEHYPGMTERALHTIAEEAMERWPLLRLRILHRVGQLQVTEPIVFVAAASAHREAAFNACAFIMDYLKTRAPFWKKEKTQDGSRWVEGRDSDRLAAERW